MARAHRAGMEDVFRECAEEWLDCCQRRFVGAHDDVQTAFSGPS